MSILIKGMEMPTTCGNCPVHKLWPEDDEAQCMIVRTLWTKYSERNQNCPLIPAPPHGRWEWIPVTEQSPDIGDSVIVSGKMKHQWEKEYERFVDVAIYNEEGAFETFIDWYEGQQQFEITHWMPLPEPPEASVGWYENNKEEYKNV